MAANHVAGSGFDRFPVLQVQSFTRRANPLCVWRRINVAAATSS